MLNCLIVLFVLVKLEWPKMANFLFMHLLWIVKLFCICKCPLLWTVGHVRVLIGADCATAVLCVLPFYFMHLLWIVKLFCTRECPLLLLLFGRCECVCVTEQRGMSVCWQGLIARLLSVYPQQAMWMMMAVSKVNNALFVQLLFWLKSFLVYAWQFGF